MSAAGYLREKEIRRHDCCFARGKISGEVERLKLSAAGDVREKEIRQLTTVALLAEKYLAKLRG